MVRVKRMRAGGILIADGAGVRVHFMHRTGQHEIHPQFLVDSAEFTRDLPDAATHEAVVAIEHGA